MKHTITTLLLCGFISFNANAQHKLTRMWATDTILAVPESVLCDAQNNVLYVSLINGQSDVADGRGGIAKLSVDGRIRDTNWCHGLNAPKGLAKFGNKLYAADLTEVAVIDVTTGRVTKKIPIEGAKFLNDITVDANGIITLPAEKGNFEEFRRP